ncbi:hypothetical protein L9F63_012309, partial [Diploptera punctata]
GRITKLCLLLHIAMSRVLFLHKHDCSFFNFSIIYHDSFHNNIIIEQILIT